LYLFIILNLTRTVMPLTKLDFYQRNCVAININISKVIYPVYILNAYKIYANIFVNL